MSDARDSTRLAADLDVIFDNTRDALFLIDVDPDGTFRFAKLNAAHERLTGLTTAQVRGRTPRQILPPDIARRVTANYRRCLAAGSTISYEEKLELPAGTRTWDTQLTPVFHHGKITRIVGSARDITERKQLEEELRILAEIDSLTGIANRRKIRDELEREIARARRHDHDLSVLMIDVDNFKTINDEYGHETGDAVLRAISTTAEAILRPSDRLGRWGGEEFVIILPETGITGAATLAGRILDAIRASRAIPGRRITVSIGVASLRREPGAQETVDSLIRRADERLYRAKAQGRNRACTSE